MPRCTLLLLLLTLVFSAGCARKAPGPEAKPLTQAELDAMIRKQAVQDPVLRSQVDYGLDAQRTSGGRILATVTNKTPNEIVVGPKCFGLVVPGRRQVIPPTGPTVKLFPVAKVPKGDQVSGELAFGVDPIPDGARLVFKQPEGQPAMAPVK